MKPNDGDETMTFNVKEEDKRKTGVYQIKNLLDGKIYIGSTKNRKGFDGRFKQHKSYLTTGKHPNLHLQSAINKYKQENFEYSILEIVKDDEKLIECEQKYIDLYILEGVVDRTKCYNNRIKAENSSGLKHSDETKKKQSAAKLGKKHSDETKKKQSAAKLGKKHSDEAKKKISAANLGENHPNYGKVTSDETKNKISIANMGDKHPRSKKVYQFDLNGNLIGTFGSTREAARKTGISQMSVSLSCQRKTKSARGFIFLFEKDKDNIENLLIKN